MTMTDPFAETNEENDFEVDLQGASVSLEGEFILMCTGLTKEVSNSGNPMWVWDFQVVSDRKGGIQAAGTPLKTWTVTTSAAMWKLEEVLVALGLAKPGEKARFTKKDAIGRMVLGILEVQEYNNRHQTAIKVLAPHPLGAGYRGGVTPETAVAPKSIRAATAAPRPTAAPTPAPQATPAPSSNGAQPAKPAARTRGQRPAVPAEPACPFKTGQIVFYRFAGEEGVFEAEFVGMDGDDKYKLKDETNGEYSVPRLDVSSDENVWF